MMLSFKPFITTLIISLGLTACGFTPVHAPSGQGSTRFTDISLDILEPDDPETKESAFLLGQRLRDRIQDNGSGDYRFRIEPTTRVSRLGISGDDVATRFDITLSARYFILDARSGALLDQGNVSSVSTFGAPLDPYGRISAEKNALQNIAAQTADQLLIKLAGFYARRDRGSAVAGLENPDNQAIDPDLEILPQAAPSGSP